MIASDLIQVDSAVAASMGTRFVVSLEDEPAGMSEIDGVLSMTLAL